MVITWPKRIKDAGGLRSQFHHCIDIVPTILEVLGLPEPAMVSGAPQKPMEGVSMAYTFDDAKAPTRRRIQYFEILGNRALFHEGWIASVFHGRAPWELGKSLSFDQEKWELYNLAEDFSQADDLAAKYSEKLRALQDLFWAEAAKYNVLPLDDRFLERVDRIMLPLPGGDRTKFTYYAGAIRIPEAIAPNTKNKSFSIAQSGSSGAPRASLRPWAAWWAAGPFMSQTASPPSLTTT
jgi:arylsulfatase